MSTKTNLAKETMLKTLKRLDELLIEDLTLIMGGGGAMMLAHQVELATSDIDAIPAKGFELVKLDALIKQIAKEHDLAIDWLNPYFSTFSHTLPSDYGERLISVFKGKHLNVLALAKEEMLIMKCFAHRQKDVVHARELIKRGANTKQVEAHIESLQKKGIPGATEALDFLDDLL